MSLAIRLSGEPAKRGLLKRAPRPDQLFEEIERWILGEHADMASSHTRRLPGESGDDASGHEISVRLHPAAESLVLSVDGSGWVTVSAETSAVGPGYHTFLGRMLERMGDSLGITWTAGPDSPSDRASVERAHLAWLGRVLSRAREALAAGATGLHLGTPRGTRFTFRGAIATPLGPRDEAWLDAALSNARLAIDVRPWWTDAMDARYLLDRALCVIWLHVRWRPPATVEEMRDVDEVLRLLRRAYPLDPALPYPWREWQRLIELRGAGSDAMARQVAEHVATLPGAPLIGYRHEPVTIIHEGWALTVPGSFAERRSAEEWWGGEGGRTVTLAGVDTGAGGAPMRPDAFLARVAADLGPDALHHRDGELQGRARLSTDASSGIEIGVLDGYSAVTGHGAAIRITFDDADDWDWAVGSWRALRRA